MDCEQELPLDVSEFKCMAATQKGVVVVFEQTNRRYFYGWHNGELAIAAPDIEGDCDPHPAEVIDCLARAVAYRAARNVAHAAAKPPTARHRRLSSQIRSFLTRGLRPVPPAMFDGCL